MADFTIQRASKNFFIGDTIGVYAAEEHWNADDGPIAAALSTAVVGTDGTVTFVSDGQTVAFR